MPRAGLDPGARRARAGGARPERDVEVYEFNQHEGGLGYQLDRQLRWLADVLSSAPTSPVTR